MKCPLRFAHTVDSTGEPQGTAVIDVASVCGVSEYVRGVKCRAVCIDYGPGHAIYVPHTTVDEVLWRLGISA